MPDSQRDHGLAAALAAATDTRVIEVGAGAMGAIGLRLRECFGPNATAAIVADENTFAAAGRRTADALRAAGVEAIEPLVFEAEGLYAHHDHVERLQQAFRAHRATPIAVGAGTINDLTKLAAHRAGRPYMAVATAASMDGYTAFGASITHEGSKQTFVCPAPRAVIVDMDVICAAPGELNAAGYADLLAKVPAGADWMLADALGVEPIDRRGWDVVQTDLRRWLSDPEGVGQRRPGSLELLIGGLLMTGLAMQACCSSRPASGAEHQFSHLWDMQRHWRQGRMPLHGCKVGIGTLAAALLYEQLFDQPLADLDLDDACRRWPSREDAERELNEADWPADLRAVALAESRAKHVDRFGLAGRLQRLKTIWPALRAKLQAQLIPARTMREMLRLAGAPVDPAQIGIDRPRLRRSYAQARQIRRRYTVLDLAEETGMWDRCMERLFAASGAWGEDN